MGKEPTKGPVVLIVLDGFGAAPDYDGNAITRAETPVLDKLIRTYPTMTLRASGEEVGLSWGEMGNSEVGHLNIGAGRVYYQSLPRIEKALAEESFFANPAFLDAMEHVKKNKSTLHLAGLVSNGKVHSSDTHCAALLQLAKKQHCKNVAVHAFLDGRDTLYNAGIDFIATLLATMKKLKVGRLASMSGRFFSMDRDHRWDRTQAAYESMLARGSLVEDPIAALKEAYTKEQYDEKFEPVVMGENGAPIAGVKEGDAIIFFNFRPDRMRQLTRAFALEKFDGFKRGPKIANVFIATMTEYEKDVPVAVAFPPDVIEKPLAQVISEAGWKQLHIAETEKYAHVTFFLNGTREDPFPGEERVLIPSPRVAAYDEVPEMSARKITERTVKEIKGGKFQFYAVNFANPDMLAHTGNFEATKEGVEVVDECIGKIVDATLRQEGAVVITADHGNAEETKNLRTGDHDKEHSTNPVPLIIVGKAYEGQAAPSGEVPNGDLSLVPPVGMLADVAPTVLAIMGLPQPEQMTGQALI